MSVSGWLLLEDDKGRLVPVPVRLDFLYDFERLATLGDKVLLSFTRALYLEDLRSETKPQHRTTSTRRQERQAAICKLLQNDPELTDKQLARRFGVDRRTIGRDIEAMGGRTAVLAGADPGRVAVQTGRVNVPRPVVHCDAGGNIQVARGKENVMGWIAVTLEKDEKAALIDLAQIERRDPRDQAALIIRQDLERRGMLEPIPIRPTEKGKADLE
jgi:DNA binding protein with HTH domain